MSALLTDLGEEFVIDAVITQLGTEDIGLYDDSTDSISDTNDLSDITTEPSGGSYARQSTAFSAADSGGDWQIDSDSQLSFDLSDSTSGTVDSWFLEVNFQADDTGDGSGTDHLLVTGSLQKERDVDSVDTLNVSAGTVGFNVT